jgi:hypothetical protein
MHEENEIPMKIRDVPSPGYEFGVFLSLDLLPDCTILLNTIQAKFLSALILDKLEELRLNQSNSCQRHEIALDENHECSLCVKEDIEHYNNYDDRDKSEIIADNRPDDFNRPR